MKNTLTDLNNHLFESLERLNDDSLSNEELEKEINRSKAVTQIANTIISNGHLALRVIKEQNEYTGKGFEELPPMLEAKIK